MTGESDLPIRSCAVPQIKRARRVSSKTTFAAFTLLLLIIGILRNYAVESSLAHRILKMRNNYSWSAQYTRYIKERMANQSIPESLDKLHLPWSPFRFLLSNTKNNDDDDEEDDKLLKEFADLKALSEDSKNGETSSSNTILENGQIPITVEDIVPEKHSQPVSVSRQSISRPLSSSSGHVTNGKNGNTERNSGASDDSKMENSKSELPSEEVEESNGFSNTPGQEEGNSDKSSKPTNTNDKPRSGVMPDDKSDEPDEKDVSKESEDLDSMMSPSKSKALPPIPSVIPAFALATQPRFKFETVTPESLSQWQDKPRIIAHTVHSLRRLQRLYITDYEAWHSSVISKVKAGQLDAKNVRVLLYAGGKEGLGDGLRGVAHAYMCAMLSKRLLLIDCNFPFPLSDVLTLGTGTNYTFDGDYFGDPESDYQAANFRKFAHHHDMKIVMDDENWLIMRKETRPSMNFLLKDVPAHWPALEPVVRLGELERNPWATEFFPLIFKSLFRASSALRSRMEGLIRDGNEFDTKAFIGIHVRFGTDTKESNFKRFRSDLSLLETAQCLAQTAIEMAKMRGVDPPRFFLGGDSSGFRDVLRSALVDIDSRAELMFGEWSIKHTRHMHRDSESDHDAFLGAFSDLLILTHSDSLLHTKSAFSDLTRWMGGIEAHHIFTRKSCTVG